MGVESIIMVDGANINTSPYLTDYMVDEEYYKDRNGNNITRFFEVDSLLEQYRFGHMQN